MRIVNSVQPFTGESLLRRALACVVLALTSTVFVLPASATPVSDSLRTTVSFSSPTPTGETVTFTVRLENAGDDTVRIGLTGRDATVDVVVRRTDSDGGPDPREAEVVWRHLAGTPVLSMLARRTLAPGEVIERTVSWDQTAHDGSRVSPGTYTVTAHVLSPEDDLVSEPKELVVRE